MSSGGEDNLQWSGLLEFRDTKHEIIVKVENDELLLIQIENCETFDQWEGKYDVTCKFTSSKEFKLLIGDFYHCISLCSFPTENVSSLSDLYS